MHRTLLFILLPLGLLFCGCDILSRFRPDSTEPIESAGSLEVGFYLVKEEPIPMICELPGRTTAYNVAEVRPQVNGIILERKFEEGSIVTKGQELYEIDSAVYKAHYDKVLANLHSLERTKDRAERLRETSAMSEQEYDDALYALEQAKADLELARLNLDYCRVEAPLGGKIGRSLITVGALVTNGQEHEMAVIRQIDPIYVDLNPTVGQILMTQTAAGNAENRLPFWQDAKVRLVLDDGNGYSHIGRIKFLDNHVQSDMGTVRLRAEFPNPEGELLPGMIVRAFVEEGVRENGILIPQEALLRNFKSEPYVWVIREDETVEIRKVRTEIALGNTWLVDAGLIGGERIVVEGIQFLAPDFQVIPRELENIEMITNFD